MPTYDYGCERCGRFIETRPMAEFALPQPCPNCGDLGHPCFDQSGHRRCSA
jgi:putative FmdB family regulatory protein